MIKQEASIPQVGYIQQFDSVPEFWQYLRGLRSDDLVAELVQNELDANSTHTVIVFDADGMTCYGNGDRVDEDGWERLTYIMGAGHLAPRKHRQIGVKNHGIKVCFTIGDDINIRSDGKMMNQTLYINGTDKPPSPATYPGPVADDTAPTTGCLIEVPYRLKHLTIDLGEPLSFSPITDAKIEELFLTACQEASRRFIGALRPDMRMRYILELKHHQLGTARFEFSCGRIRTIRGLSFYNRTCCTSGEIPGLPEKVVENCCLFSVPLPRDSNKEIPDFYAAKGRFFLSEISWRVEGKNRPVPIHGHRRYPIEYGGNDQSAFTGLGVNFSAPYISDLERRGVVQDDAFNECIENTCVSTLAKILRSYLMPKHGARSLDLLIDPHEVNEVTLRRMVEIMLDARTVPILRHKPIMGHDKKRPQNRKLKDTVRFGPRKTANGEIHRIVLPMYTWNNNTISRLLSQLCPSDEDQIDPLVPSPILSLLESEDFGGNFITFDETDVIARLQPTCETKYFPWNNDDEWKRELGDPNIIHLYLDILMAIYEHDPDNECFGSLLENAYLPDITSTPAPISELYAGINLPSDLPVEDMPPILHPSISSHRIFRKVAWRRPSFTFNEYLERSALDKADEQTRALFWRWLKNNWRLVKIVREKSGNPWPALAGLQIWPDRSGNLQTLSALCKPRRKRIASILAGSINNPHTDVSKIGPLKEAKRGLLRIRSIPTESEIIDFLEQHLSRFPEDRALSEDEKADFRSLEKNLAELASDEAIRSHLKANPEYAFALSKSGYVRPIEDLVQINNDSRKLYLVEDYIMDRKPSVLDKIDHWKARTFPSSEQVLRALKEDPRRDAVLYRRLRAYLQAAKHECKEDPKEDIIGIECIPDNDKLYAPGNLAFKGVRADYWGDWKHRISGKGISADIQQLYRDVGVLGTEPTPETSLEFFRWLNTQRQRILDIHLPCIIRHINHSKGPMSWSAEFPNVPFIPVTTDGKHVYLIGRASASSPKSMVFIQDHDALADAIKNSKGNRGIQLVVTGHPSVNAPITQHMQRLGIKSLRDYAGNPIVVQRQGCKDAPTTLLEELRFLCGRKMSRELRKRLDSMGLPLGTYSIKSNWRERLMQVESVNIVDSIEATFKIGRYSYTVPMNAVFDESSKSICFADSLDDVDELFYSTIAERIFENTSQYLSIILREAVRKEFRETDVYGGLISQSSESDEDDDELTDGQVEEAIETEPGGTKRTHRRRYTDPRKNLPEPGELPVGITGSSNHPRGRGKRDEHGRESPKIEEIQIENLKQNQYAWHCQVCLTERATIELAPANSYVEIQENRSRIMIAHHPDQVNAGGARHAGNILILCNYHHNLLGDRISREDITKALERTAHSHTVVFGTSIHGKTNKKTVSGKIVTITIPLQGEIRCFFTRYHADYWLKKAT